MKRKELRFLISRRVPNSFWPTGPHRHVGVATEAAFLHVAVANAYPLHQGVQRLGVGHGFRARTHVGLGDDFQQRRAGAVEVDAGTAVEILVQRLAGIFFEVGAGQVHVLLDRGFTACRRGWSARRPAPPEFRTG
jgi:hypothetical protein